mmetsp:Transcript_20651/g.30901  ORF Transcript_20651/g.30901 Transcript_20651/m.30901 type:complete len:396 (+) Transcript_20651:76-1263(+)
MGEKEPSKTFADAAKKGVLKALRQPLFFLVLIAGFLVLIYVHHTKVIPETDDAETWHKNIGEVNRENYPFRWGFMDEALACDVSDLNPSIQGMIRMIRGPYETCGDVRVVMQYPKSDKFHFYRRMEFANALLCNLAQCTVKEIHLLQEDDDDKESFFRFFRAETQQLLQFGSAVVNAHVHSLLSTILEEKVIVHPLGNRIKYIDAVRYVNDHPEWKGKPIILTNGDISISEGFDNQILLKALIANNSGAVLKRYEPRNCDLLGDYWHGFPTTCDCVDHQGCFDSYLVTYPLPHMLTVLGEKDGIDFRFGGLWNSEDIFVKRLKEYGLKLRSPCLFLQLKHHHCSQSRPTQAKDEHGNERWLADEIKIDHIEKNVPLMDTEEALRLIQSHRLQDSL